MRSNYSLKRIAADGLGRLLGTAAAAALA